MADPGWGGIGGAKVGGSRTWQQDRFPEAREAEPRAAEGYETEPGEPPSGPPTLPAPETRQVARESWEPLCWRGVRDDRKSLTPLAGTLTFNGLRFYGLQPVRAVSDQNRVHCVEPDFKGA